MESSFLLLFIVDLRHSRTYQIFICVIMIIKKDI